MAFKEKYTITPAYLTSPSKRRSGLLMSPGVKFIVAHDTGNPKSQHVETETITKIRGMR
jgi:hypothetical protein